MGNKCTKSRDASSAVGARLAHTRQRLVYKFNIVKHLKVTI